MEKYLSTYGEVKIGVDTQGSCNIICLETEDNTLGRAEVEIIMQKFADQNGYGEVGAADEYEEGCWSARILD